MKVLRSLFPCLAIVAAAGLAVPVLAQGGGKEKEEVLPLAGSEHLTEDASAMPPVNVPVEAENVWDLDLSNGGRVRIQLRPDVAPKHVERIKTLSRQGFYNGLQFHRVIDGFMAQGGDPKNDGTGGSTLPDLQPEFNGLPHLRGTVSMARANDPASANSQFFIMFLPRMQLDHNYTVFGRVIEGMQYVDAITRGQPPAKPTVIVQASIEADGKPRPALAPPAPPPPPVAESDLLPKPAAAAPAKPAPVKAAPAKATAKPAAPKKK